VTGWEEMRRDNLGQNQEPAASSAFDVGHRHHTGTSSDGPSLSSLGHLCHLLITKQRSQCGSTGHSVGWAALIVSAISNREIGGQREDLAGANCLSAERSFADDLISTA
jgi:hypothetical protein